MNTNLIFSSKTDQWATPQRFFDELNNEFHFDLDPCADEINHKCEKYFNASENGLLQNWGGTESFVIRRMAETFVSGLRKHIEKATKIIRLYAY